MTSATARLVRPAFGNLSQFRLLSFAGFTASPLPLIDQNIDSYLTLGVRQRPPVESKFTTHAVIPELHQLDDTAKIR